MKTTNGFILSLMAGFILTGCGTTRPQRMDVYSQVGEAVLSRYVGEDIASGLFDSLPQLSGNATTIYYLDGEDVTDRIEIFQGTRYRPGQTNEADTILGDLERTAELAELFEALLTELVEKEFSQPEEVANHNKNTVPQSLPQPADVFVEPVPTMSIAGLPDRGAFSPVLKKVYYKFTFTDRTVLDFHENHAGDFWGDFPNVGFGRITWPDGTQKHDDINTKIRKGIPASLNALKPFVPARWNIDHMRDGLLGNGANPTVIRSVMLNKGAVGITADIADIEVEIIE